MRTGTPPLVATWKLKGYQALPPSIPFLIVWEFVGQIEIYYVAIFSGDADDDESVYEAYT